MMKTIKITSNVWHNFDVCPNILTDYWKEQFKLLEKIVQQKTHEAKVVISIEEDLTDDIEVFFLWHLFDVHLTIRLDDQQQIDIVWLDLMNNDLSVGNILPHLNLSGEYHSLEEVLEVLTNDTLINFAKDMYKYY